MNFDEKKIALRNRIRELASEDVILAFSGGVDSALLLKLLCEESKDRTVYALTLHTMLHPRTEAKEAKALAESMGAYHITVNVDEIEEADIQLNPKDRCYRCKKCLFTKVITYASEHHISHILEGTNEDDLHIYRPGIRAVRELGIISPLAEVHMTKEEVRKLAEELQVSVAHKPSTPCLATRFPYGTKISYEGMKKVEEAEDFIKNLGVHNVRVRVYGELVRIEVDQEAEEFCVKNKDPIISYMKQLGYTYVTLDLEGFRSGSMDVNITKTKEMGGH